MIQLTEAKLTELLNRAYNAGARGVWDWQRRTRETPRLQDLPKLETIRVEALAPLIEEARQHT